MLTTLVLFLSVSGCLAQFKDLGPLFRPENGPIKFIHFAKSEGYSLAGHVVAKFQVARDADCAMRCLLNSTCSSFNYGGTKTNGLYSCELNNSHKFAHPTNLTIRHGFLYGGINTPFCSSNPCVNGGTCKEAGTSFTCSCPLSIRDLPYTDDKCSVDISRITRSGSYVGVFMADVGRYKLTFYEARRLCEILGATLASYNQLNKAWKAGWERCAWAWMNDGKARFPMHRVIGGCGGSATIIASTPSSKYYRYDAMCYKP